MDISSSFIHRPQEIGGFNPNISPPLGLGKSPNQLKKILAGLDKKDDSAHSAVEFRMEGKKKVYTDFIPMKAGAPEPKCPNEKLPVTNGALKKMVKHFSENHEEHADKEFAFLTGGMPMPDYCEVTTIGSGLGLYYNKKTGKPMGED